MNEKYEIRVSKKESIERLVFTVTFGILSAVFLSVVCFMEFKLNSSFELAIFSICLLIILITLVIIVAKIVVDSIKDILGKGERILVDGEKITILGKKTKEYMFSDVTNVCYITAVNPVIIKDGLYICFGKNDYYPVYKTYQNASKFFCHLESMGFVEKNGSFYKPVENKIV